MDFLLIFKPEGLTKSITVMIIILNIEYLIGRTTYTCMTNKDGGTEADITVSVLENGDGSSIVKPKFEGKRHKI